ncbi:DUF305 domain-containing protein [Ornithinimicrobium sp. F0845]|uniref:DUF305 domain-containing protein n=1 Tax=Ornithinimicrobium sp. F0845 TaxID=2926412 RepID=UPI001FF6C6A9|nr:DUF305 domain-containing protein [Ornithinimicrobium sp. F0845]MCK0110988.1 DUF305 domain-containing protein [Ornithinimicrobium sp. F0845]
MTRRGWASCALVLVVVLAGCSGGEPTPDEGPTADEATSTTRILQPGKPGEDNAQVTGDISVETPTASVADTTFMQEMIHHHAQALEMVDLVEGDLQDAEVQVIAARIRDAQGLEIEIMATWLTQNGDPVPAVAAEAGVDLEALGAVVLEEHAGHGDGHGDGHDTGHGDGHAATQGNGSTHTMPGMASPEQLQELGAAAGREADLMFLELMTAHHAGALVMLDEHGLGASDLRAMEIGDEMSAEQRAEIGRMEDIRARLEAG